MIDMVDEREDMTRFERARIIGARALQIARGAPVILKTLETDPIRIAEAEFAVDAIPIRVRRKMPKQRTA